MVTSVSAYLEVLLSYLDVIVKPLLLSQGGVNNALQNVLLRRKGVNCLGATLRIITAVGMVTRARIIRWVSKVGQPSYLWCGG